MGNLIANACVIALAVGNTRLSRIRNGSTRAGGPAIRAARSSAQHVSTCADTRIEAPSASGSPRARLPADAYLCIRCASSAAERREN
jgi:hypothetical protein